MVTGSRLASLLVRLTSHAGPDFVGAAAGGEVVSEVAPVGLIDDEATSVAGGSEIRCRDRRRSSLRDYGPAPSRPDRHRFRRRRHCRDDRDHGQADHDHGDAAPRRTRSAPSSLLTMPFTHRNPRVGLVSACGTGADPEGRSAGGGRERREVAQAIEARRSQPSTGQAQIRRAGQRREVAQAIEARRSQPSTGQAQIREGRSATRSRTGDRGPEVAAEY